MKRAFFGTGFCAPPQMSPMPTIRPWVKAPSQRLQSSENKALQTINPVLEKIDASILEKLMNLFDCDENFLTTFPELDHYQDRGSVRYWGACMSMDEGVNPVWPGNRKGRKIFAYLKGGVKGVLEVLQVLKDTPADVIVYGPGLPLAQIKKFQTERLIIVQKILNLKKVCKECDLVICHTGHATLARALVEGIPVVMLPTQVEQFIMSTNIVRFGAGTMVNHQDKQPDYAGAIHRALNDKKIKQKAEEFAARHADFDQKKQVAAIVSRIEELIAPVS